MEENNEQLLARLDMDELFDDQISLKTLIGNDSARAILQVYIDEFFNNRLAGLNPKIAPILLIGGKGTGIHVMARAISNSLGNLLLHTICAQWLNDRVIPINAFLADGDEFSAYYIDGERLNSHNQFTLSKIFSQNMISVYDYETLSWQKRPFSRLVILSVVHKDNIPHILLKKFKLQVNLTLLNTTEIEMALRQRIALLNIKICSYDLLTKMAQLSSGIGQAMDMLVMSQRICKNQNNNVIMETDFNKALLLLDKNFKAENQKSMG